VACDLLLSDCGIYGRPISHLTVPRGRWLRTTLRPYHDDALIVLAAEQACAGWPGCHAGAGLPSRS